MPSKSINIDARLYEQLKKMKGRKSFSTVIRQLLDERERLMLDPDIDDLQLALPRVSKESRTY